MPFVTTDDGVEIYYKDWGPKDGRPIHFHHGWPLSSDDWDAQMLFFQHEGFRVVAHDRRGHGRSTQVSEGHDMAHYASDARAVVEHLDLRNVIHVGHSTGGGEVARYIVRYGQPSNRVSGAVLISSVPPLMIKTPKNPEGQPAEVLDQFRQLLVENRSKLFYDFPSAQFYGYNRLLAKPAEAVILNWWRMAMMGGASAQYDGIRAFSETDQTADLEAMTVPTLIIHGDDDQAVPYKSAALRQEELIRGSRLKVYKGAPHGVHTTHTEQVNSDILDFIRSIENRVSRSHLPSLWDARALPVPPAQAEVDLLQRPACAPPCRVTPTWCRGGLQPIPSVLV